jgi:hypothetical protein
MTGNTGIPQTGCFIFFETALLHKSLTLRVEQHDMRGTMTLFIIMNASPGVATDDSIFLINNVQPFFHKD